MAQEPARWNTLGQWASVFAMSERNLARLVVKETGLSFRRWRHQLQLIPALQALIAGRNVQQTAQMLGYDSTTAFITMFKKARADAGPVSDGRVTASPQLKRPAPPQSVGRPARRETRDAKYRTDQQPGDELRLVSISVMPRPPSRDENADGNRDQRFPVHKRVDQCGGR